MARGQGDSRVRAHAATAVVVVVGLAVTAALTLGARAVHDSNEKRLLNQRSRELGDVLGATIQSLQTPLVSAAEVAEATNASPPRVGKLLAPLAGDKSIFRSSAVWSSNPADPHKPVLVFGGKPSLAQSSPRAIRALLARAKKSPQLSVTGRSTAPSTRSDHCAGAISGWWPRSSTGQPSVSCCPVGSLGIPCRFGGPLPIGRSSAREGDAWMRAR